MEYRFALEKGVYEDLASGRVLYSRHGTTAFPARLASELFQRAKAWLTERGNEGPYSVYDPCGGGGYLLAELGFLHGKDIRSLVASDVDGEAVGLASQNLGLLTLAGLAERQRQLEQLAADYGKASHREALDSVARLRQELARLPRQIATAAFQADGTAAPEQAPWGALSEKAGERRSGAAHASQAVHRDAAFAGVYDPAGPLCPSCAATGSPFDLVITDLPYGALKEWQSAAERPVEALLGRLVPHLAPVSLVVVISAKEGGPITHERYRPVSRLKLGKRRATLLELLL